MTETSKDDSRPDAHDPEQERAEIAETDEKLDAQADGDGLGAEAGKGEETGLAEG